MSKVKLDDTIVAISTPIGEGGIGIVRLSGKNALKVADKIFVSRNGKKPSRFKTYTVHYGHIKDNARRSTQNAVRIIDEVILTVMRAPRSYTKENIVEINCHSGIVPLRKILGLVLKSGARLAQPGEFTKRAFLNGRIDILQAESVLDIIKAKTDLSLRVALNNLEGEFSKKINATRDELIAILAHIEASIDFPEEEDVDRIRQKEILQRLRRVRKTIEKVISTADHGKVLRQGIKTVICGSPNVGKSSLMNAILRESRAIVTHLPGTTRDTIEEIVNIKGIPVILVDTAGISTTGHPIEKEGIKRSHFSIETADLILFVLDYGRKLSRHDKEILRSIKDKENVIIVINKKDLKKRINVGSLPKRRIVYTSAIKQMGIDRLENIIKDIIFKGKVPVSDLAGISNERQLGILHRSLEDVKAALDKAPVDCIAVYVRSAIEGIGEITGHTITEEALDRIFSEFCIGK